MSCGQGITKGFLGCRAVSGRVDELAVLCCCIANGISRNLCTDLWDSRYVCMCCCFSVCVLTMYMLIHNHTLQRSFMKVLSDTMELFPSYINRTDFLSSVMDIWKECIKELFEDYGCDGLGRYMYNTATVHV